MYWGSKETEILHARGSWDLHGCEGDDGVFWILALSKLVFMCQSFGEMCCLQFYNFVSK
jgi:hypothetical protein